MKKYLLILLALIGVSSIVNAQGGSKFVSYERDNGWNIGFNMGATWQPREGYNGTSILSKPYAGFGGGMTLGKSIYEKEGSFFALDLRGRYLGSYNAGWVGVPEYGYEMTGDTTGLSFGFRNYKMHLHEFSLEAVLTLNKLREKTGIILYGFGGIGATMNKVNANHRDFDGDYYNYSTNQFAFNAIDTSMNAQAIAAQVQNSSDHTYETPLTPLKFSLVPSWGIGFGYQIGPSFSMGVEYKLAYDLLGDEFDGGAANNMADNVMDKYHYTGAFFRWNILTGGGSYEPPVDPWTPNPGPTNPQTNVVPNDPVTHNKPLVNIYNPSNNNKVVHNPSYTIKAKVYHVETQSGVKFTQNGLNNSSFTFNPTTNEFTAQVYLYPGSNVFEITGTNPYGSDNDSRIIILEQEAQQLPPPVVDITNPSQDGMTVNQPQYTVVSNVLNVNGKNDITFTYNGQKSTNFTYSTSSKVLTSVVTLNPGKNTIIVKGVNTVGSDYETITINYEVPVSIQPPVVNITNPSTNPYGTNSPVEVVQGTVHYVNSAADISVLVNGNSINNFTYSTLTKNISFSANLIVGANVVQITGTNQFGLDSKTTTIIYSPSEVMPLPIVDFVVPSTSPYTSQANNITLKATVLNVPSKKHIDVTVNGTKTTAFSYNSVTKEVTFNVNLINGSNLFTVTGTNSAGTDMDEQIIIHKLVEQQPPVVNITNPSSNPYNTSVPTQVINASILNVDQVSGVSATFNGQSITNFTFDPVTDKFVYLANLIQGANVLEVTGTNNVGTASKSQTIIYTEPVVECDDPSIVLTQPVMGTKTTTSGSTTVQGSITINTTNNKGAIVGKITGSTAIEFKINGVSSPGYNFDSKSGAFESFLHLEEGANNYQIVATNDCGTEIKSITYIYTPEEVPCDEPVIHWIYPTTSPFDFTGPSVISLSASVLAVNNSSKVTVKINGQSKKFVFDPTTGSLAFGGPLAEGANEVVITGQNECGTVTESVTINYTAPIAPPTVTITNPATELFSTFNGSMTAKATVTGVDAKSQIQVFLEGQSLTNFGYNNNTKQVSVPLNLALGTHTLDVRATNPAGSAMDETEIDVQEECVDPVINLTQPTSGAAASVDFSTSNGQGVIVATILHAENVTFKINGQSSPGYNFNPATGHFESLLNLSEGTTSYEIVAVNHCNDQTTKGINITYTPTPVVCDEPVVTYVNPSTNPFTSNKAKGVSVSASVIGISNANQVECTVNGNTVQHSFNNATNMVSFTTTLLEGNNPVSIIATNQCGSTTQPLTLVFDKPIPAPEVDITTPSQDPTTTSSSTVLVRATVLNVSGQSAIEMTVDGQSITNFSYSYTSKILTSNLDLDNGTHTIVIKGTNSAGSDQDQTVIEVQIPVTPPEVSISNVTGTSSSSPYIATSCIGLNVMGVVSHATASQITYTVNGATATGVNTNAVSSTVVQFSIPVTFAQPGEVIAVTVTATTPDGTDSETVYVTCEGDDEGEGEPGGTGTEGEPGGDPGNGGHGTINTNGEGEGGEGNGNGNNGHGNNDDGVDVSNPGQGGGGPNGETDPSGNDDDEGGNGSNGGGNSGNNGGGNSGNNGGGNGNGSNIGTVGPQHTDQSLQDQKNAQYNEHVTQGDSYYNQKMYDEAYNYYQKALSVKPGESHPKNRITAIEEIKKQEEVDAAYDAKIKKADLYFKAGKYSSAKTYYMQASSIKPSAAYPKNKIAEVDKKLNAVVKPTNTVKPNNNVIKPTNSGGGKTGGSNSSGGSKTNTTPKKPSSGGSKSNTGGSKTTTTPKPTTPKATTPKTTQPKPITPTKIGGGK